MEAQTGEPEVVDDLPGHIGNKYPGGYEIIGEVKRHHGPGKAIYLQKVRFVKDNRIEFRFAYYVIARKGKVIGKWIFANRPVFIPPNILTSIFTEAKEQNWEAF